MSNIVAVLPFTKRIDDDADDGDDDDVYRCSPLGFSATCCSRGRTESMYKAPLAAAIRPMCDLGSCRDEITGHNTGI